jgi:hypothetical protein
MLGAIAGDAIGFVYEARPPRTRFTGDTVLAMATAAALLGDGDYGTMLVKSAAYRRCWRAFPNAG